MYNFSKSAKSAMVGSEVTQLEKITTDDAIALYPNGFTLGRVDLIPTRDGSNYAVAEIKGTNTYINGGKVLTDIVRKWVDDHDGDIDATNADLAESEVTIKLGKATSKSTGRIYTRVEVL